MNRESTIKRLFAILIAGVLLASCASGRGPQILTFNYKVLAVPDATALIASVRGGQTAVSDLLLRDPCNFTADFSGRTPPQIFPYGAPGQAGFNVNIVSTAPINLATTNPASCPVLRELAINIGGQSEALAVGGRTSFTNGRIWFTDGRQFSTSQFFQAQLQSFDPGNRRSSGTFRFIDTQTRTGNTVLIAEGSWALTP